VIPTFSPSPLATDEPRTSNAHIDVAFDVTRYGDAKRIAVLSTMNADDDAPQKVVRLIARSTFRPRVTGDQFVRASRVVVRYYLNGSQITGVSPVVGAVEPLPAS
jgi:hypothetical protein